MDKRQNKQFPSLSQNWKVRFFTIWSGQAFSLTGSALVQFALVWWLTKQTGSATILATASIIALLPQIFISPFAGTIIDRGSRRSIMVIADTAIAAATAVLIYLFVVDEIQVWHIYVILFIRSLGQAFHQPAMTASTSLMVPGEHLARIAGLNQLLQGFLSVFTPPLGALLISVFSTQTVLALDLITAAVAVLPLLFISIPQPVSSAVQMDGAVIKTTYWQDLKAGFDYVIHWQGGLTLILLTMLLNFLLIPSSTLLPLLVMYEFRGGAVELGWVESAFGAGAIVSGLMLSAWGGFRRRIMTSLLGISGIGIGVTLLGIIPADIFWLILAVSFLIGAAQVLANGPIWAIMQSVIEPDFQGRVFSLLQAGATAMMPLSLMVAGPVSDVMGVRAWYVAGGVLCLLSACAAACIPAVLNIEKKKQHAQELI